MAKTRILQIFGDPISYGGQEKFVYNIYKYMSGKDIIFDLFTPFYCNNDEIKKFIEERGGKIFHYDYQFKTFDENKKYFVKSLLDLLGKEKYNIVHIHSGSIFTLAFGAKIAKKSGAKNVIVHSHNSGIKNMKYRIMKAISNNVFLKNADYYFACSELAARFKYPKKILKNKNYQVINNGIDITKFKYDQKIRKNIRKELDCGNKIVIGHIGRFAPEKNHTFLLDVFEEYKKINNESMLVLIGVGALQETVKEKAIQLGIKNDVQFLGTTDKVNEYLNAMDIFVLPSLYEGLPIVGVEAEATGLPVISSVEVIKDLPIKELTNYYSLNNSAKDWALKIDEIVKNTVRKDVSDAIVDSNYEISNIAKKLEGFYESIK